MFDLDTLANFLDEQYDSFTLLSALKRLIDDAVILYDKYNSPVVLKENNDIFFISDRFDINFDSYYTQHPTIDAGIPFSEIMDDMSMAQIPKLINKVFNNKTVDSERSNILKDLPLDVQAFILEKSLEAKSTEKKTNAVGRQKILEYYKQNYYEFGTTIVSTLLPSKMRCWDAKQWVDCKDENKYRELIRKQENERIAQLLTKSKDHYNNYYGLTHPHTGMFCIKQQTTEESKSRDKRKMKRGKVCTSYKREDLIDLAVNVFKIDPPSGWNFDEKEETKWKSKKVYKKINIQPGGEKRALYWSTQKIKHMCEQIKEWLKSADMLVISENCGSQTKL
jgi:hypothetical protein